MASQKSVQNKQYQFDLDQNPLSDAQIEFLEKEDIYEYNRIQRKKGKKGYNISQFRKIFRERLDESLRTITWILKYTHNLKKDFLYEIFNAKSLEFFVKSILRDPNKNYSVIPEYKYDLKNSENAKLFFEVGVDYLVKSPQLKSKKEDLDNLIKSLRKYFEMLSKSTLQQEELYETIDQKEQEVLEKKLERFSLDEKYGGLFDSKKHKIMVEKQIDESYKGLYKLDLAERISSGKIKLKIDTPITTSQTREEILEQIAYYESILAQELGDKILKESIETKLSHKYDHLEQFACRINPLDDFKLMFLRLSADERYIKDKDQDLREEQNFKDFENSLIKEFEGKPFDKKKPCVIIRKPDGKGIVVVPKEEFEKKHKEFFKEEMNA